MRRLLVLVLPALFVAAGSAASTAQVPGTSVVPASPAAVAARAQVDHEDARRGLIYDGLQRVADSDFCRGAFRAVMASHRGVPVCTHGPDPAPEGVDVRDEPVPASSGTAMATSVPCVGNGSDGFRVQLIYARASDKADGYANWLPSMQQWAAQLDDVFNASAAETGGVRHVRFVHDASCVPVINNVVLSPSGDNDFDSMLSELRAKGFSRSDRKYLVWMDANVYCGIAQVYFDDSPDVDNASNGPSYVSGEVGRIDKGCWGQTNMVEAHELVHLLGGVQTSAPNATPGNHCTDNYDRLCYDDGTGAPTVVCPDGGHENRLDCNHDDYYSTAPPAGSYLATHWNVANSRFLTGASSGTSSTSSTAPPPTTTTTISRLPWWWQTTTTTRPPSVTTTTNPATTTTTAATTTTTRPPSTTTTQPPSGVRPSPPVNLIATQPTGTATGVSLSWSPPSSPGAALTGYRVYRGAGMTGLTPIADVGAGTTSYVDATGTPGSIYWYYVTALNGAGESNASTLTRMVAK